MLPECLMNFCPRKSSMENYNLTDCTGLNKVARPHKKGAVEYQAKRISDAQQKCAQRKATTKASQTELSSLTD